MDVDDSHKVLLPLCVLISKIIGGINLSFYPYSRLGVLS